MLSIQKNIEKNRKMQTRMKAIAAMCVFIVFFCSFNSGTVMNIAFIVAIPVIAAFFVLDSNYAKNSHSLEIEIYLLELESLKKQKENEENNTEFLQGDWMDSIEKPAENASLPIIYYSILIIIDIVLRIF